MAGEVHRLHLTIDDQLADRYREVPFEVAGHDSVEVTLRYDTDRAVVDLGCEDPHRWRGWSGGARARFVITRDAATPGYEPGPLPDGRWAVVLGLHALPAEGVDVEVTITVPAEGAVEADPPAPARPEGPRASARALPALDGLTWFAGDFHSHTLHSDGDESIDELAAKAVARGLDFLAITEHNTVSHHPHLAAAADRYDLALLPGQEITTARGHANAFGDIGWIDFRQPADTWVREVAARGGLLSVNHPIEGDVSWLHPLAELPPALEMWPIGWFRDLTATAMWGFRARWRDDAILLGGSDYHGPALGYPPGTPTTWVAAVDRTPDAILDAVRQGRTAIARVPTPGAPTLLRLGDELVAVDAEGTVLVDVDDRRRVIRSARETLAADTTSGHRAAGRGPYRLESPERSLLAITA